MTRAERACRALPTWMLRAILRWPARRHWWSAAWLEIWRREVLEVVQAEADASGAWAVDAPKGVQ